MDQLTGLCLRISTAESLLHAIETAASQGSTHQLDYIVAEGEWRHRTSVWFLNEEGIHPQVLERDAIACLETTTARELINREPKSQDHRREMDYWHGFSQAKALNELRTRIAATQHPDPQLPDEIANALGTVWQFPSNNRDCLNQFPTRVEQFANSPSRTYVLGIMATLSGLRDRLTVCMVRFGLDTTRGGRKPPRHEDDVRECVRRLEAQASSVSTTKPFEALSTLADMLAECINFEAVAPWAVRYRCERLRLRLGCTILSSRIDDLGVQALKQMGSARVHDSTSRSFIIEAIAVVQQVANWSFFPKGAIDFCPTLAWGQVLDEDLKSQQAAWTYLRETWLPVRAQWNALAATIEGAVEADALVRKYGGVGQGGGLPPANPPGRPANYDRVVIEAVEAIYAQNYKKGKTPLAEVLATVQSQNEGREGFTSLTVDDIRKISDAKRQRERYKRNQKPKRRTPG